MKPKPVAAPRPRPIPWAKVERCALIGAPLADIVAGLVIAPEVVRANRVKLDAAVRRGHAQHRLQLREVLHRGSTRGLKRASALVLLAAARQFLGWDRALLDVNLTTAEGAREHLRDAIEKFRAKKAAETSTEPGPKTSEEPA